MLLKKQYRRLKKLSSGPKIITLFLLAHSIYIAMILFTFPKINAKMGAKAFDMQTFGYSQIDAVQMVNNLDQATTNFYIFPQLFLLDLLYPILLALFLSVVIIRLSSIVSFKFGRITSNLYLLPFLAMLFDYLENIFILFMITNLEELSPAVFKLASTFTLLKGGFTTISWIIILILLIIWLIQKLTEKKRSPTAE